MLVWYMNMPEETNYYVLPLRDPHLGESLGQHG